jgi:hypothetical protein
VPEAVRSEASDQALALDTVSSLVGLVAEIAAKGQKSGQKSGKSGRKDAPEDE